MSDPLQCFPPGSTPVEQAHLWLPHPLYDWQADALKAAALPYSRVVLSTSNESGKTSSLAPLFLLSVMAAFPGARCFATSGSERQVKAQLFESNLIPLVSRWPDKYRVIKGDMKIEHVNGSSIMCYVCADPKNVEGFHSKWGFDPKTGAKRWEPCAYFMDECKSIPDEVWEGVLRINPYFLLAVSTPGEMGGWFYKAVDPDTMRPA